MDVRFFFEEVDPIDFNFESIQKWIHKVIRHYKQKPWEISIIFCSDEFILKLNQEYLNHDYYTDILTFNYSNPGFISGDLFISIETVKSNSSLLNIKFEDEINRVIVHGILHLLGFDDSTNNQKEEMTQIEDYWLEKFIS